MKKDDSTARKLPPRIRPRTLERAPDGYGYVTTDGRYSVTPSYNTNRQGGRTVRVSRWYVTDLRTNRIVLELPTLTCVRDLYCAPGGRVPWLVCGMDEGVMRVEATRTACVEWAASYLDERRFRYEYRPGGASYEYFFGHEDDDEEVRSLSIMRADLAHHSGYDPVQQPLYPFPDDPYEYVKRPESAKEVS